MEKFLTRSAIFAFAIMPYALACSMAWTSTQLHQLQELRMDCIEKQQSHDYWYAAYREVEFDVESANELITELEGELSELEVGACRVGHDWMGE